MSAPFEIPLTPHNSPEEEADPASDPDYLHEGPEAAATLMETSCDADADSRPPCAAPPELPLSRMEGYCLPGSLPVLLELRESSSEAGSSSQTPQSPEGPDEFFDTQESMEVWMDSPDSLTHPETPVEASDPPPPEP